VFLAFIHFNFLLHSFPSQLFFDTHNLQRVYLNYRFQSKVADLHNYRNSETNQTFGEELGLDRAFVGEK
jgi:hypothetical protein